MRDININKNAHMWALRVITGWTLYITAIVLLTIAFTGCASREVCAVAKSYVGKYYNRGAKYQCGNFVGTCVTKAGGETPDNPAKATNWLNWGMHVPWALKQPGDVIITWRNGPTSGDGHILIYIGGNKAVHRSTYTSPVKVVSVENYQKRLLGVRRGYF